MSYPATFSKIRIGWRRRRSYSSTDAITSYSIATGSAMRMTSSGCARAYAATKLRRSWLIRGSSRRLAVLARRPGPRVRRLLEELVLGRGPELADVLDGVDHGVLQAPVLAFDATDVDVVDRLAVLVEADRPAGRVGATDPAHGPDEPGGGLDLAAHLLESLLEEEAGRVGADRVVGRLPAERLAVGPDEAAVRRRVEGGAVVDGRDDAERLVAHVPQ